MANIDLYNFGVSAAYTNKNFTNGQRLPAYRFEGNKVLPEEISTLAEDSSSFPNGLIRINYVKDSLHPFFKNASALRENLVIIYGDNESFFGDVMNCLNEFRDTFNIKVIGMPDLERFRYLDEVQANNMNLTYFASNYVDYQDAHVQEFVEKFRQAYHTDPDIYGFSGFDIAYYFIDALVNLDKRMRSCIDQYTGEMLLNNYNIRKAGDTGNYENSYWHILRYERLSTIKLPDPDLPESSTEE